jgi:predicted SprT family Zn-dependent metalloprotease
MLTTQQFQTLDDLFTFYNVELFNASLPECIINMSRKSGTYGFFAARSWTHTSEPSRRVHEISLNPDYLQRPFIQWHSTLVHEMCHLWQEEFGKPGRTCYHNKQWAAKMIEIGLMPSDTGSVGGKTTGQSVSHYVIEGRTFQTVFNSLNEAAIENLRLKYLPISFSFATVTGGTNGGDENEDEDGENSGVKISKSGKRTKYTCACGNNVWGRSGLLIQCNECDMLFKSDSVTDQPLT